MRGTKIVLDLEFIPIKEPQSFSSGHEIIEIGAVQLNAANQVMDDFQMYVKPQYGTVPPMVTKITGITDEMLESAICFSEAMQAFESWLPDEPHYRFYTWSHTDQVVFLRESEWKERPLLPVFHHYWVDLQRLHQRIYHFSRPLKLVDALGSMQIPFEGIEHGALADAQNTAKVLQELSHVREIQQDRANAYVTYNNDSHTTGFPLKLKIRNTF
jgi:inhibitor of KinA sporulation pathway (predicted exonuclease)